MPIIGDIKGESLRSTVLMDRATGQDITDGRHLANSIVDILTTPLGSRVMRREYGSRLFDLIDRPINKRLIAQIIAATVEAIHRWEPRLRVTQVKLDLTRFTEGVVGMDIDGWYFLQSRPLRLAEVTLDFFKENRYSLRQYMRPEQL